MLRIELAEQLAGQGETASAIAELRAALRADPNSALAAKNLAWILTTDGNPQLRSGEEAVRLAESCAHPQAANAPEREPLQEVAMLDTLAAAYAEAGRFDQAVSVSRRALELVRGAKDESLARELEARLELYEAHQPYHVPPAGADKLPTWKPND